MAKFRKKPVVIEAVQWTGDNLREVIDFTGLHPSANKWSWEEYEAVVASEGLKIFTLEGPLMATVGDWIIKGVKGEFYPCKPDIFEATYEPVYGQEVVPPWYRLPEPPPDGWEKALCECGHSAGMHSVMPKGEYIEVGPCFCGDCRWFRLFAKETDSHKLNRLSHKSELSEDERRWLAHYTR